jgi:hypothetical protein
LAETETDMRWSIRHDRALIALLEEDSIAEASLTARVSRAALTRWLKHPVFRSRLEKAREELFTAAKSRLLGAASQAVGTLQNVMGDETMPPTARVAAARSVLGLCVRIKEIEIADQLDRLENGGDDDLPIGAVLQ